MRIQIDPPWEWSWQRRASIIVLIFSIVLVLGYAIEDLRRADGYPVRMQLARTWFSSTIVAVMIAMVGAGSLRILLWVLPEKRPADRFGLEILFVIVFVWFGAIVLVTDRALTVPEPVAANGRPMTDEEAACFLKGEQQPKNIMTSEEFACHLINKARMTDKAKGRALTDDELLGLAKPLGPSKGR
jgi:hypothetical protein